MKGNNIIKRLSTINQTIKSLISVAPASILSSTVNIRGYASGRIPKNSPYNTIGRSVAYTQKTTSGIDYKDIKMITLFPDSEADFKIFEEIITHRDVIFTSSWIDQYFGIETLKEYCSDFELKLKLAAKDTKGVTVARRELMDYKHSKPAIQIALDNFFSNRQNNNKLRESYKNMTSEASNNLGYYKFIDQNSGELLGGGALVPLKKPGEFGLATKVDIALHILRTKQGIGTICLDKLFNTAFGRPEIEQVWGSSVTSNSVTFTLCSKYGMRIENVDGKKYYYISRKTWEVFKKDPVVIREHRTSAADQYFSRNDKDGSGGR